MEYIVDKSIITSLANEGCTKNAINMMATKWKEKVFDQIKNEKCNCGSEKIYMKCCGQKEYNRSKIPGYSYVEERLGITIPHVDKAPLITHMRAGEFAEIKKIEELSYNYTIGTNLKEDEDGSIHEDKRELLTPSFYNKNDDLKIQFNRNNFEELGKLIYERKIKGNDFMIGLEGGTVTSTEFAKIIESNKYDFLYQLKFKAQVDFFKPLLYDTKVEDLYEFSRLKFSNLVPDFIKVIGANDPECLNCLVLDENLNLIESQNQKIKLMVADIKNAEFSNKFFIELGLYMLALNSFIYSDKQLKEKCEVVAKAAIYPEHEDEMEQERYYRIKNEGPSKINIWEVNFATIKEELINVFKNKLPSLISIIEDGKIEEYNKYKITSMCMTCDYYGGQYSKDLEAYIEKQKEHDKNFAYSDIEEYLNAAENNFCRYCVKRDNNINILPTLANGEKNILINNSINDIESLNIAIDNDDALFSHNKTLKSNINTLKKEVEIRKNSIDYEITNNRTINLPKFSHIKIFIDIQSSTKDQTLSFAYGLNYFNGDAGLNVNNIGIKNAEFSISMIDEYSFRNDLREFLEFLFKLNELIKRYESEVDRFGNNLTYSIIYWGENTYNHLRDLFLRIFDYIKRDGEGIESIYTSISMSTLTDKKKKVRELKDRFYTLFAPEDEVQDYRIVEKSPFFDMKKAVRDIMVIRADINLNLYQVNKLITGYNTIFKYHKPDSDSFNGNVFGKMWASEQMDSDTKDKYKEEIKGIIKNRLKSMMGIYLTLSSNGYLYGVAPTIIPLHRENPFGEFTMGNDLYMHHKLDNAYSLVEKELIHNEEIYRKSVLGKAILLDRQILGDERDDILLNNGFNPNDNELIVYRTNENCKEANYDEKSICLTIYPIDKSDSIFKKFVNKNYNNVIYYDSSMYNFDSFEEWRWKSGKPYKSTVEVKIEKFLRFNNLLVLRVPPITKRLMDLLINEYEFDFTQNVVVENYHADFWSKLLKKTIEKVKDNESARSMLEDFSNIPVQDLSIDNIINLLKNYYTDGMFPLDESQIDAIRRILNNKLTLLWGPPGTGKTYTIVHLLLTYYYLNIQRSDETKRILIMCNNYDAFDNILKKISDFNILNSEDVSITRFKSLDRESRNFAFTKATYKEVSVDTYSNQFKEEFKILSQQEHKFQIIATTPNQIGKIFTNSAFTRNRTVKFDMVIVDEASQMDVGHFLPALLRIKENTQFVLAGDDLQLPPITKVKLKDASEHYYGSIFSYYLNEFHNEINNNIRSSLLYNRRSNSTIVNYSKLAFNYDKQYRAEENQYGLVTFGTGPDKSNFYDDIIEPEKIICMLTYKDGNSGQMNKFEAEQVVDIVKRIWERGVYKYNTTERYGIIDFFDKCIGVVVPHRAQRTEIQSNLIKYFIDELKIDKHEQINKELLEKKIISSVDTVERYQGQEREIIICSYVLGDTDVISLEEEFIYNPNRLNVMISRARFKVIVLASNELVMNISNNLEIIGIQQSLKNLVEYCDNVYYINSNEEWEKREGVLRYASNK
jgi:superfamily I DNA and/or RNA helicase